MTLEERIRAELNPAQAEAVLVNDRPQLILAGAGSGKTRVLTWKIAWLIGGLQRKPWEILALTFTNKAAGEMKERVGSLLRGKEGAGLTVSTFHNLGLNIIRNEHAHLGYKSGFSIFDADDSAAQIKDLMPGAKPDAIDDAKNLVSRAKNAGLSPEQALAAARSTREMGAARLYARYQARLSSFNAVDFDDLIRLPVQVLEESAEVVAAWRERIGYLLVDECQPSTGCSRPSPARAGTPPAWATTTRASMPGAAPTRKTCSRWRATTRPCR